MAEQVERIESLHLRVRGTRDGIVFYLPEDLPADELVAQVREAVDSSRDFFKDAQVVLDFDQRTPDQSEIERIEEVFAIADIRLRQITASRHESRVILNELGHRPLRIVARRDRDLDVVRPAKAPERTAVYVRRTLRSGATVHSDGDLVIMGDVNAGAQVTAVGDIIVWGVLRGMVHAGSDGSDEAMICALKLQPTQIRIGAIVARPPDNTEYEVHAPQCAYVTGPNIVVEPWRGMERRGR
jgi:septum site-determining protein MinC